MVRIPTIKMALLCAGMMALGQSAEAALREMGRVVARYARSGADNLLIDPLVERGGLLNILRSGALRLRNGVGSVRMGASQCANKTKQFTKDLMVAFHKGREQKNQIKRDFYDDKIRFHNGQADRIDRSRWDMYRLFARDPLRAGCFKSGLKLGAGAAAGIGLCIADRGTVGDIALLSALGLSGGLLGAGALLKYPRLLVPTTMGLAGTALYKNQDSIKKKFAQYAQNDKARAENWEKVLTAGV